MKMQYFIALIEVDTDKLNERTGADVVNHISELKDTISHAGVFDLYQVTEIAAFKRFRNEIKRLNP